MKTTCLPCALLAITLGVASASPLSPSIVTEIINQVSVLRGDQATAATLNEAVTAPERVRTGAASRAELTAPDQSITRIGANTVFSFTGSDRTINLEKGSLLFHSPKGTGGGTIKSAGASAAVLGTTIIVIATPDGGFKVIVLEGRCKVILPNGKSVTLKAGQLVFVLPSERGFSRVITVNLGKLVGGSFLVNGFSHELSSLPLIRAAIDTQSEDIAKGRATDTGVSPEEVAGWQTRNGLDAVDHGSYQMAVHPPVSASQLFGSGQGVVVGGFGGSARVPLSGLPGRQQPPGPPMPPQPPQPPVP